MIHAFKIMGCSLLLLITLPTIAQDFGSQAAIDFGSAMTDHVMMNATLNPNYNSAGSKKRSKPVRSGKVSQSASLTYVPTTTLRSATVQEYVERFKSSNPAISQAVANNFGPGKYDYSTIYANIVKGYGLKENDAADVVTANLVLAYMIVNNLQSNNAVSIAQVNGAKAQFGPKLAQSPQLKAAGAAAQLGEKLKLLFVVMHGGWQSAIKENALPAYQQQIGALFKTQYGIDLSLFILTSKGFVLK